MTPAVGDRGPGMTPAVGDRVGARRERGPVDRRPRTHHPQSGVGQGVTGEDHNYYTVSQGTGTGVGG